MKTVLPRAFFVGAIIVALLYLPPKIEHTLAPEAILLPRGAEASQAPIWSRRCAEQGRSMIAHQADGGPWIVRCTGTPIRL